MNLPTTIKIDFVSDISCPWCAIGLAALEAAVHRIDPAPHIQLHFQPFELNPAMPKGGQDITEHLTEKYGSTLEQQVQIRETIRQRGAALGFEFRPAGRDRIYNTFDAHRLLHWAGLPENVSGEQHALKKNLLAAYFTHGQSPELHQVLLGAAKAAGLNVERAEAILSSDEFTDEVRERQRFYTSAGIHSVPAVILNDQFLISGGQPVEVFENALRQAVAARVS